METDQLQQVYARHARIKAITGLLQEKKSKNIFVKGLNGSSGSFVVSSVWKETGECVLCVLNDLEEAGYFYHDLCQLLGDRDALFFPSGYRRAIRYGQADQANQILRTEVLSRLRQTDKPCVVVSYPEALAEKVVDPNLLQQNTLKISKTERIDSAFVTEALFSYGFDRVDYVYEPGQFAVRGSIVDVFSFSNELPYRIDFFGDEVESIRSFEVETQLSMEKWDEISIIPAQSANADSNVTLLSHLPTETILVFKDYSWTNEKWASLWDEAPVLNNEEAFQSLEEIRKQLVAAALFRNEVAKYRKLHLKGISAREMDKQTAVVEFNTEIQPSYRKNFEAVSRSFTERMADDYQIYILSDSQKQISRIQTIFEDRGDKIVFTPVLKTLHEGFIDHSLKVCFFTDHQLFERFHKYNLRSEKARSGKISLSLKELNQFQIGDYIVHIDHGVGRFGGLLRTDINGRMQEVIKLTFLNDDIIFVNIHSLHKLSKYKGKDGVPPKLNKLGSPSWGNVKEKTKKKVKDIARDLIVLYSRRKQEKGFAFSHDSYLQQELEASFTYEDTPDQLKVTAEIKQDMENDRPMDRLVCGDVGFGKTEVAVRAAFKAVADSKQVGVLVPTTVLAFQHAQTFKERLAHFPCRIEYLSRARKPKEVKQVLQDLKNGKVDILIGTHRLVGKDVQFKDLGLLIIDEEQKFGVSVKEKLKLLKVNVDTLTLTATPIPRTLQFSLMGARDFSTLTTPPPNRYPIQTEVHRFGEEIIKEAVNFELSRNGQVFLINNRIQTIYDLEATVRKLIPDARVVVGHGQMDPGKLETIIADFIQHEYDVLIATSIVENGIDIPNANTIIVNNAHTFGLSDLHQLRGRVGRGNKKAFCYLLAPPLSTLTVEARRRLQAIENLSELGSGIHIAMQDLDIRGAGNLLGEQQSGFIADLGYEVYQKILEEAVQELKNEAFGERYKNERNTGEHYVTETVVDSDLELSFAASYIPNDAERVALYRELDGIQKEPDLSDYVARLEDRFGRIPPEGKELIHVVRLKWIARTLGVEKLMLKSGKMTLYLVSDVNSTYYESGAFHALVGYLQQNQKAGYLKMLHNKCTVTLYAIRDVATAHETLSRISLSIP